VGSQQPCHMQHLTLLPAQQPTGSCKHGAQHERGGGGRGLRATALSLSLGCSITRCSQRNSGRAPAHMKRVGAGRGVWVGIGEFTYGWMWEWGLDSNTKASTAHGTEHGY
jgi:hypothetical protein